MRNPHILGLDVSLAKKDGKWGALDSEGKIVIPFNLNERLEKISSRTDVFTMETYPRLIYDDNGQLSGVSYAESVKTNEFVLFDSEAPEYYGSFLGKGAVLICDQP
jgi:hypothetical protein